MLQAMENFAALFEKTRRKLVADGKYHRANLGDFSFGLEFIDFIETVGLPRSHDDVLSKTAQIFNSVYLRTRALLDEDADAPRAAEMPLRAFMDAQPLA